MSMHNVDVNEKSGAAIVSTSAALPSKKRLQRTIVNDEDEDFPNNYMEKEAEEGEEEEEEKDKVVVRGKGRGRGRGRGRAPARKRAKKEEEEVGEVGEEVEISGEEAALAEIAAIKKRLEGKRELKALDLKRHELVKTYGIELDDPVDPAFAHGPAVKRSESRGARSSAAASLNNERGAYMMEPPKSERSYAEDAEEDTKPRDTLPEIMKAHCHLIRACRGGVPLLQPFFYKLQDVSLWGFNYSLVTPSSVDKKFADPIVRATWNYRPGNAFKKDSLQPASGRYDDQTPITLKSEIDIVFQAVKQKRDLMDKGEDEASVKKAQADVAPVYAIEPPKKKEVKKETKKENDKEAAEATTPAPTTEQK